MKISVTVNLDHCDSIKIESSESNDPKTCLDEVRRTLIGIGTSHTGIFVDHVLSDYKTRF